MLRQSVITVLLVTSLLSACQTAPTVVAPPPAPLISPEQLFKASQLQTPLLFLQAPLYDPEIREWIPQNFLTKVEQTISSTVNSTYTQTQLQQAIAGQLTPTEMQTVVDFYQSAAGQAVLNAENNFEKTINLRTTTPNPLVMQLWQSIQLEKALNAIFLASADAVIQRLDTYDCLPLMQIPGSHIGLNIAKRNRVDFMQQQVQRSLANLYQPLSESELQAYVAFAQSTAGQHYFAVRNQALVGIGHQFGEQLAEAIAPGIPSCVGSIRISTD